ncbi:unnamed protein product [Pleuronectes platessa]|uniref:Uncharacterized protein n=1 Tax=Pleuronectes platessa TaxID=8262 RepID=A0A9N7VLU0_PLEPL|nr:unnamed protein product [Pleuronectes platessa]
MAGFYEMVYTCPPSAQRCPLTSAIPLLRRLPLLSHVATCSVHGVSTIAARVMVSPALEAEQFACGPVRLQQIAVFASPVSTRPIPANENMSAGLLTRGRRTPGFTRAPAPHSGHRTSHFSSNLPLHHLQGRHHRPRTV